MATGHGSRVLVIGARGVLGSLVVDAFLDQGWSVRRGARRPTRDGLFVDLDQPETVAGAMSEDELVVNTVPHCGLAAERLVLEQGGMLINVSALPAAAARSLRAVAGDARGTVLMNAGLAPGVTNLVAAELLDTYPHADELEMVFTLSTTAPRGPASADFVHRGLTAVARHRAALIPLPEPFGERLCLGFGENDPGWLGGVAEGRLIRTYLCIVEPAVHQSMLALNRGGDMTKLQRRAFEAEPPGGPGTAGGEPIAHWIAAVSHGRRLGARTIECKGDFIHAARATVAFAHALLASAPRPGCFDPEELFLLDELEPKLRAFGIEVVPQLG
jgi:hypothetical protein